METLEIRNVLETYYYFDSLQINVRTMPSMIMLAIASKLVIFLMFNVAVFFAVMAAGWKAFKEVHEKNFSEAIKTGINNIGFEHSYLPPSHNQLVADKAMASTSTNPEN